MREKIKLESTAGTGHFYTTTKNKRTSTEKLEMSKFDPKARKHVTYKEVKLKSAVTSSASNQVAKTEVSYFGFFFIPR